MPHLPPTGAHLTTGREPAVSQTGRQQMISTRRKASWGLLDEPSTLTEAIHY
jgi:hypothetical protein